MSSAKLRPIDLVLFGSYFALFGLGLVAAPRNTLSIVALCLSAACAGVWLVARWQLGSAFSIAAEAHNLVTHGLYSKIRHPIYVFGTMAFLFVVLALQGWFGLIIWAIVLSIQVLRIRREDRVLMEKFGEEYSNYRKKTWF